MTVATRAGPAARNRTSREPLVFSERVRLQIEGPRNVRRHLWRAVMRFIVLVLADLATFFTLRAAIHSFRDSALLGRALADLLGTLIPRATLGGGQFAASVLLALLVTGNYGQGDARRDARQLFVGSSLAAALALWARIWTVGPSEVFLSFVTVAVLLWLALFAERLMVDKALRKLGLRSRALRAVFVGSEEECLLASTAEPFTRVTEYEVLGFLSSNGSTPRALGRLQDLHRVLLESQAESLVICGYLEDADFKSVISAAHDAGCELLAIPRRLKVTGVEPELVWRGGQPLMELTSPAFKGQEQVLKRLLDMVVAAVGLAVLAPVFALVALAIKADSRGPVFYQSLRWGRFGRKIGIWKFRTMVDGAAGLLEKDGQLQGRFAENIKIVNDPRVTRMGRVLRRTSIDELPQLFNVLIGEMSLVGPRPKLIGEEQRYGAAIDTVLAVRPGVTGLWQISGRNGTTYEERIALDIKYASHPSLWGDLEILVRTIPVVLQGTGAH